MYSSSGKAVAISTQALLRSLCFLVLVLLNLRLEVQSHAVGSSICGENAKESNGWCVCDAQMIVGAVTSETNTNEATYCHRAGMSFGFEVSLIKHCVCAAQTRHSETYGRKQNDSFLCGPDTQIVETHHKSRNKETKRFEDGTFKECSCALKNWIAMDMRFRVPCGRYASKTQIFPPKFAPHCQCVTWELAASISGYHKRTEEYDTDDSRLLALLRHFDNKMCPRQLGLLRDACRETPQEEQCLDDHPGDHLKYAIYPRALFTQVQEIIATTPKTRNYCFMGASPCSVWPTKDPACRMGFREWIIPFIDKYFDDNSYLDFTDLYEKDGYKVRGAFDKTKERRGFFPARDGVLSTDFDSNYWKIMASCKYVLTPAGDSMWSMRFYETLVAGAIPIANTAYDYHRSAHEAIIPYRVARARDFESFKDEGAVEANRAIFEKYHLLPPYK
eukprot:m.67675 g.67675  ORF g.67675 m.67675 type:complete len:446 (+) comp23856_c0_seq2:195-1532(+)